MRVVWAALEIADPDSAPGQLVRRRFSKAIAEHLDTLRVLKTTAPRFWLRP